VPEIYPRLGVATWADEPEPHPDDRRMLDALPSSVEVTSCAWDDPEAPWASCDAVLIRTCVDYHLRVGEFVAWAEGLEEAGTPLWNAAAVVTWNSRKTYLRELGEAGLPIVPTIWLEGDDDAEHSRLVDTTPWEEVVVKPIVGASSYLIWHGGANDLRSDNAPLERIAAQGGGMLQPFVREIRERGEWSLIYFEGRFSHAVLKRARAGEYRVQAEFGGSVDSLEPPAELRALGEAALDLAPVAPLYARVDAIDTAEGFLLSELELIEPELFLGSAPEAPGRFAAAVVSRLEGRTIVAP
jgi:glutathione synthase/RimK-type ligase-like ATP-grasp enzyme